MTREQIAADLLVLVVRIGNELPPLDSSTVPADVRAAEWAYVKGLASHGILRLRDSLLDLPPGVSLANLGERSGPARRVPFDHQAPPAPPNAKITKGR